jgi:ComEC/Rec2-related protein
MPTHAQFCFMKQIRVIHWGAIPFVWILAPWALGIVLADYYTYLTINETYCLFFLMALIAVSGIPISPLSNIRKFLFPIFQIIAVVFASFLWTREQQPWHHKNEIIGHVHVLTVEKVLRKSSWGITEQGERVFLRSNKYPSGTIIKAIGEMRKIKPNLCKNKFDFYTYARRKNIRYSIKPRKIQFIANAPWYRFFAHALQWRDYCIQKLTQGSLYSDWIGALLFGDDRNLDDSETNVFQKTGTLHVLAVSGLHVGILFSVVEWLLQQLPFIKSKKWIRFIISNCILWWYALMSGFAPSIARSVYMFSLSSFGRLMGWRSFALNHLFVSAFFILFIDPSSLFHLGFQLSFVAVASILLLEPLFTNWLTFAIPFGKQIGSTFGVTLAAQTGTAPLGLFYFHQFPLWFLPANVVAVPLSSLLLLITLAILPLSLILPDFWRITILDFCYYWFLKIMEWFDCLPGSIEQITIGSESVWLYFTFLLLFRNAILYRSRIGIFLAVTALFLSIWGM